MTNHIRILDNNTAIALGINEALFLSRLDFWISQGYGEIYNGKRWIYNTFQQWSQNELPLTPRQVQKAVYNLRDKGILLIEKLRSHQWKQTNYYSIHYDKWREYLVNSNAPDGELDFTTQGNDPITERTDQKEHSKREQENKLQKNYDKDNKEQNLDCTYSTDSTDNKPETEKEPDRKESLIRQFHNYLIKELSKLDWIRNAKGYSQKVISNLLNGSASSQKLYDQWKDKGWCDLTLIEVNPPDFAQNRPQNKPTEKEVNLPTGFKEWLIGQLQMPNETRASALYRANKIIQSDQLSEFLNEFNWINDEARSRYQQQEEKHQQQSNPTAGETNQRQETNQDDDDDGEFLDPIENSRNAIALIQKFPHHHIGFNLLEMAKNQASDSELKNINQLIEKAGINLNST